MVAAGLRRVFARGGYILLAAATGLAVFILATWLPNLGLVGQIVASETIPFADKVKILTALVGSIGTNFTVFSALTTIAIAALFGANVAMMAYYFRSRRQLVSPAGKTGAAASFGGLASGLFGVGCAACGTFVLGPVLAFLGAGGLIALIGILSGAKHDILLTSIFMRGIRLQGILVGHRAAFEAMNRAIDAHRLRPVVDKVLPAESAREGLELMQRGGHFGKICLTWS